MVSQAISIAVAITIIMSGTAGLLGLLLKYLEYRSRTHTPGLSNRRDLEDQQRHYHQHIHLIGTTPAPQRTPLGNVPQRGALDGGPDIGTMLDDLDILESLS